MEEKISIKRENVLTAYEHASEEQKTLLENLFDLDMLKPKDIMERVKTFEDACEVLGEDHQYVKAYREWMRISYANCKDISAYLKLRIICAALNEGWKPTFDENEHRYYPWFFVYPKEEYESFAESEKEECCIAGITDSDSIASGGIAYAFSHFSSHSSGMYSGSRLALMTRELAEYCGRQFIDIWAEYLA